MTEEEKLALIDRVGSETAKAIEDKFNEAQKIKDAKNALENKATKEEIEKINVELKKVLDEANALIAKQANEFNTIIKLQGEEIGKLKVEKSAPTENTTFRKALFKALEAKKAEIKEAIAGNQRIPLTFEVKVAVDYANATSGQLDGITAVDTGIISGIRRREEKYLQSVSVGSIAGNRAIWLEETDEQGDPIIPVLEGATKIKLSTVWIDNSAPVQKIAVFGKVSTEMMEDLPQLMSYIETSLLKRLMIAKENQLLVGSGVSPNLFGAKTLATTFSAGANADAIVGANEFDVLDAIALQVEIANGVPNAVYIHPATWAKMKAIKDTTLSPIWRLYVDPKTGLVNYAGMNIFTSTGVPAGEFIGGDMEVLHVLFRSGITVQIGLDGSDFTENKKTIVIEQRMVQFAGVNDKPCIIKGVFGTAIAALQV